MKSTSRWDVDKLCDNSDYTLHRAGSNYEQMTKLQLSRKEESNATAAESVATT
jgi:hypothetical protein